MRKPFIPRVVLPLIFVSSLTVGSTMQNQVCCRPARAATDQAATELPVSKAISLEALKKYKQISIDVETEGKKVRFSGVPLRVILGEMVPELNLENMPGWKALSRQELVMEALGSDGYPGLITATELAINKSGDRFLLATERDGKPNEFGVQLICKMDEARTRWVREVASLRVVSLAKK